MISGHSPKCFGIGVGVRVTVGDAVGAIVTDGIVGVDVPGVVVTVDTGETQADSRTSTGIVPVISLLILVIFPRFADPLLL